MLSNVTSKNRNEDHSGVGSSLANLSDNPSPIISPLVCEIVRKVTKNAHEIDDKWAKEAIGHIGEGKYAELVSLVVNILPIDIFCLLLQRPVVSLPVPKNGKPSELIPDGCLQCDARGSGRDLWAGVVGAAL